jgi:Tol biopolymer transport system component
VPLPSIRRLLRPLAGALCAALLTACDEDPSGPRDDGVPGRELLMVSHPDSASAYDGVNAELYVLDADGTGLTRIVSNPLVGEITSAHWAPDGRQIAFVAREPIPESGPWTARLYAVNVDGSALRQVTPADVRGDFAWSPDGMHIAYSAIEADESGSQTRLHMINADGTGDRVLTPEPPTGYESVSSTYPSWSPDGRHIVFLRPALVTHQYTSGPAAGSTYDVIVSALWVVSADTADARMIAHVEAPTCNNGMYNYCADVGAPRWSPAGSRIVFLSRTPGHSDNGYGALWSVDSSGADLRRFDGCSQSDNVPGAVVWSPDGARLVYTSSPTSFGDSDIGGHLYLRGADGAGCMRLTGPTPNTVQSNYLATWSPDGRRLAFLRADQYLPEVSGVYVANADGTAPRRILATPSWSRWYTTLVEWSPGAL